MHRAMCGESGAWKRGVPPSHHPHMFTHPGSPSRVLRGPHLQPLALCTDQWVGLKVATADLSGNECKVTSLT